MEPTQKAELLSACRQYADAKFKLRRFFPSLKTYEEIDNIASVLIDVASSALTHAINGESKRIKRSLDRVEKAASKPMPAGQSPSMAEAIRKVLTKASKPVTSDELFAAVTALRGSATSSKNYMYEVCSKRQDLVHHTAPGVYELNKGASPGHVTASASEPPTTRLEQVRSVLMANGNKPMSAKQIEAAFEARGFPTNNSGKYPFTKDIMNILLKRKDVFVRKDKGVYAVRKGV